MRVPIMDFALANPAYVGATVTFWKVINGVKSAVLADVFEEHFGAELLQNPQTLDSEGKFGQPCYVEDPVVMTISGTGVPTHDTGVVNGFNLAVTGSITRSASRRAADFISVLDFIPHELHAAIAARTNTTNLTTYIQAAITYLQSIGGGTLYFPGGDYLVTSTLTVSASGIHLLGAGRLATRIVFAPSADDVCLEVANGASMVTRWSVSRLSFFSGDSTHTKTAIDATDGGSYSIEDVEIGGSVVVSGTNYWSGDNSIGIRTRGREFGTLRNLWITADRPVVISQNPNDSGKALDHFDFDDLYLIANANPCIGVDDGCRLVNVTFRGAQPWVRGTHGFYWVDTQATAQVSSGISFDGIRTEQGTDTSAYSIYISLSGSGSSLLSDVSVKRSLLEAGRNGIFLRNVRRISIDDATYQGGSGKVSLDMTGITNSMLSLNNAVLGASTTMTLTGMVRVWESRPTQTTYPIGECALYAFTGRDGLRHSVVTTGNLPTAGTTNINGTILIEDASNGAKVVFYEGGVRYRLPGCLEGSATFDPSNLADGAGETTTVTVTGAVLGDFAEASFSGNLQSITLTAWVSAADTVSVRFQNESGGAVDLASGTLRAIVRKAS